MKNFKKVLSSVLAALMILGTLPAGLITISADDPSGTSGGETVLIAGSDFDQQKSGLIDLGIHADEDSKVMKPLLQSIAAAHPAADGLLFCGDYDLGALTAGVQVLKNTVKSVFSGMNENKMFLVKGELNPDKGGQTASGSHDTDAYGLYVLGSDAYPAGGGSRTAMQTAAAALDTYLTDKADALYDKPVFIASYMPLHYSSLTVSDGDAKYASCLFDVINKAGERGLTIIFLYGHNHDAGADDYLGGSAVYLPAGHDILIADPDADGFTAERLNFTYMNAGYTVYYEGGAAGACTDITMTCFTIRAGSVTIERFGVNGAHELKSAGVSADAGLPAMTDVISGPRTVSVKNWHCITEAARSLPMHDECGSGITISSMSGLDAYVAPASVGADVLSAYGLLPGAVAFDITVPGFTAGSKAEVAFPLPEGFDPDRTAIFYVNGDKLELVPSVINDGKIYFTTTHFSVYTAAEIDYDHIEWIEETAMYKVMDATPLTTLSDGQMLRIRSLPYTIRYLSDSAYAGRLRTQEGAADPTDALAQMLPAWTIEVDGSDYYLLNADGQYLSIADSGVVYLTDNKDEAALEMTYDAANGGWKISKTFTVEIVENVDTPVSIEMKTAEEYYVEDDDEFWCDDYFEYTEDPDGDYYYFDGNEYLRIGHLISEYGEWEDEDGPGFWGYWYFIDSDDDFEPYEDDCVDVYVESPENESPNLDVIYRKSTVTYETRTYFLQYEERKQTAMGVTEDQTDGTKNLWDLYAVEESDDSIRYALYQAPEAVPGSDTDGYAAAYTFPAGQFLTGNTLKEYLKSVIRLFASTDGENVFPINDYQLTGTVDPMNEDDELLSVYYRGHEFAKIRVTIREREIREIGINTAMSGEYTDHGIVPRLAGPGAVTGTCLDVTYVIDADEADAYRNAGKTVVQDPVSGGYLYVDTVPVTVDMLEGTRLTSEIGEYPNLTIVLDQDHKLLPNGYTLHVVPNAFDVDYPEYPREGSVRLNKTGYGVDFRSTGLARIELEAAGVPRYKSVDVTIIVDTSNSMLDADCENMAGEETNRIVVLREQLANLMTLLQTPHEDGSPADVRVAIADFNNWTAKIRDYNEEYDAPIPFDYCLEMVDESGFGVYNSMDSYGMRIYNPYFSEGNVYTGSGRWDADAYVDVAAMSSFDYDSIKTKDNTSYDEGFEEAYRLVSAIQEQNAADGVYREQIVIFMTDGGPNQYNGFLTDQSTAEWNNFLTGHYSKEQINTAADTWKLGEADFYSEHPYYYGDVITSSATGETIQMHRTAQAIKGDTGTRYEILRLHDDPYIRGIDVEDKTNMQSVPGLGAKLCTISFCMDDQWNTSHSVSWVSEETAETVLRNLASVDEETGEPLFYAASSSATLAEAFKEIADFTQNAGSGGYLMDQMGLMYDLYTTKDHYDHEFNPNCPAGTTTSSVPTPTVRVISYDIYQNCQIGTTVGDHLVTQEDVGRRYGSGYVMEVVTFNDDGTVTSVTYNKDGTVKETSASTILGQDGVVRAANFFYNTTNAAITVDNMHGGSDPVEIPSETFYWFIGDILNSDLVLEYYAYLSESMEGGRPMGVYETNTEATLYYENMLGHDVYRDTVSPELPWQESLVEVAYYLVDKDGNPIIDTTTGTVGSFENRVVVKQPELYSEFNWNGDPTTLTHSTLETLSPDGYTLYDEDAAYTVRCSSDGTGSWTIGGDSGTTYVANYGPDYSYRPVNTDSAGVTMKTGDSVDYSRTTVWVAVTFERGCVPDVVVIDYGKPVDIDVIANDMLGEYGKVVGISTAAPVGVTTDFSTAPMQYLPAAFRETYIEQNTDGVPQFGSVSVVNGRVRYSVRDMTMTTSETFWYAAEYCDTSVDGAVPVYYFAKVTVVPATILYYEDDTKTTAAGFITYTGNWTTVGTVDPLASQEQDRPGLNNSLYDKNNVYGFDHGYETFGTYSDGSAHKITVTSGQEADASFTFTGTGFDVIALTNKASGYLRVLVYEGTAATGDPIHDWSVDTYYGYNKSDAGTFNKYTMYYAGGAWHASATVVSADTADEGEIKVNEFPTEPDTAKKYVMFRPTLNSVDRGTLYQIPVLKSDALEYGTYTVRLVPTYAEFFDHTKSGSYDLYLDAIRIYGPADTTSTGFESRVNVHYGKDNEMWPAFIELRDILLPATAFKFDEGHTVDPIDESEKIDGAVFIDAYGVNGTTTDYVNAGPNNEVYLDKGQSIAFKLDPDTNINRIHLAAKCVSGSASFTVNGFPQTTDSATDLYYDVTNAIVRNSETADENGLVVITNTGDNILSLTNIKITYLTEPVDDEIPTLFMTPRAALFAVNSVASSFYTVIEPEIVPEQETEQGTEQETDPAVDPAEQSTDPAEQTTEPAEQTTDPAEEPQFKPEFFILEANRTEARIGKKIKITVTTSDDVASVTVNGQEAVLKKTDKNGHKVWKLKITAEEAGTLTLTAQTQNEAGQKSGIQTVDVTVSEKKTFFRAIGDFFRKLFKPSAGCILCEIGLFGRIINTSDIHSVQISAPRALGGSASRAGTV